MAFRCTSAVAGVQPGRLARGYGGRGAGCGLVLAEGGLGEDAGQPAWQPPVGPAEQFHHGGHQHEADHGRVDQDGEGARFGLSSRQDGLG
jgi:hypothetical protein